MGEITLEYAGVSDIEALADLDRLVFPGHPMGIDNFVEAVCFAAWRVIVARQDESQSIVGYCTVFPNHREPGAGQIGSLATHPDWQNRGIATRILTHAFDVLLHKRCKKVGLFVSPDNFAALGLYKSLGFEPRELIRDLYGAGHHRLRMEKQFADQ